jgi:hypothetical protein
MTSTKRPLRRDASYEERAIALATRLGIETPKPPLTSAQWSALWAKIGKALLRIEPPEPLTLQILWADVGMYLAEENEPEFQWGPGRRPGSKSRNPRKLVPTVSDAAKRQRRHRDKKRAADSERDPKLGGN